MGPESVGLDSELILVGFDAIETKLSTCAGFGVEPSGGVAKLQRSTNHNCSCLVLDDPTDFSFLGNGGRNQESRGDAQ
jgi:hypothetical protein